MTKTELVTNTGFMQPVQNNTIVNKSVDSLVVIKLSPEATAQALQMAEQVNLTDMPEKEIVLFGNNLQKDLSNKMDAILVEITKTSDPIIFQLFQKLKEGVTGANIPELEKVIRKNLKTGWVTQMLESVGLSTVAGRLQKANVKINSLINSKATNLRDLIHTMEDEIRTESMRLIDNCSRLKTLGNTYRESIENVGIYITAGKEVQRKALEKYDLMLVESSTNKDPIFVESVKRFKQLLDMFDARILVLETVYTKAPVELEYLRMGEAAALSTLAETANTVVEDFNDIKSILIKLSVVHQIQSVQLMNAERRDMKKELQNYSSDLLETVSVTAEKTKGINRLEDATQLLTVATKIKSTSDKVEEEKKNNKARFNEARKKLVEVKTLIQTL